MKHLHILFAASLLTLAHNVSAGDTATPVTSVVGAEPISVFSAPTCKPSGDGSFTEIVTTMASVLPPEQGDALLARYCDRCNLIKFSLAQGR